MEFTAANFVDFFSRQLLCTLLLFSFSAVAEPNSPSSPSRSLYRKTSFASYLLNPDTFPIIANRIPRGCGEKLRELYASGQTLFTESLYDGAQNITKVPYVSGVQDAIFYHYTFSDKLGKILHKEIEDREEAHRLTLQEGGYDAIFNFLRNERIERKHVSIHASDQGNLWLFHLYVAEDPKSSKRYGNRLMTFEFSTTAKVIENNAPVWKKAIEEIKLKWPEIAQVCQLSTPPIDHRSYGCTSSESPPPPFFIVAEDSNIDLLDYSTCGPDIPHQYFQVLSPEKIIRTEVRE